MEKSLSFDDVLLVPQRSGIHSRRNINLITELFSGINLNLPILSANMPSVTGVDMAVAMHKAGGMGVLHRMNDITENLDEYLKVKKHQADAIISLGINEDLERADLLYDYGARYFCIDVAHGHHDRVIDFIPSVKDLGEDVCVIAGNVATAVAAGDLAEAGADAIKVGIGPGAACTTREVTGFGVPQITAIKQCSTVKELYDVTIIADGGIKNSGDIVKALAFGADTVMIGSLLAGCNESPNPGEYFGNASKKIRDYNAPEGIEGTVELSGPVKDVLKKLAWGIKSGLSYAGAESIFDLHENGITYVEITPQTTYESGTRIQ